MNRISLPFKRCVFALAVVLLGWSPGVARAQTLYGITFSGDQLITIDTVTGAGTVVGPLSSSMSAFGLAFRGTKLYAFDQTADRIRELDPTTGSTLNTINIGANLFAEGDIAFRSDGIGFLSPVAPSQLIRFDITVPNSAVVGPLAKLIDGMAFNAADVLFGLEQGGANLYTIDPATGATTLIGGTGLVGALGLGGLAFDSGGNLFGVVSLPASPGNLYKIDTTTGAATLIGNIGINEVSGIAFGSGGPPPPPTAGVTITQSGGATNVTEGGATDTYDIVLKIAPTADVTITITGGTQVTVAPANLTFTTVNWNVPQTVTVTAVDDALVEGAHTGTITHTSASADLAYNAVAIASVTANITDNDVGPPPPTPPPAPPPGGGIDEGTYAGSKGVGNGNNNEGTFGFGRQARSLQPFLKGPYRDSHGNFRVFNVAHQQSAQATAGESGLGVLGWGLLSLAVLAPAVLVYGRRRPA